MKKRTILFFAIACTVVLFITGCQGKTNNTAGTAATTARTVTVVTGGGGLPYSLLTESNEWTGIDGEMWAEIEKRTGWNVVVKRASFDSMFGELSSLRADVAANCFAIKAERSEKYYPSIAYYGDAQCLTVKNDNTKINTFNDLAGKKVGVSSGQASETILEDMSGKYNFELVVYEGLNTGYADVDLGRLDVMGGPVTGANQYMDVSGKTLRILDEKLLANNVGYYFQKTDAGKALCEEVNKVIQEMLDDGTCGRIVKKYLYEDMTIYIN
ncbi:probable amino-acid ABC transporter,substrate-binding protein [Treponema primitia ZAS-2]|uniref:Probable amino-acid ABC transporter,substrate-binding protein n=2 Tax=Treponema primitia TaxID=88058 RepID=D8L159_TREPZ|nr:putative ABC-type amino acid transporter [Treponema primitia ZAS-2]AEF87038.1 probable amino-acid ABC transporter,substrate-binding protein [Treponema primitia ZAS-2]